MTMHLLLLSASAFLSPGTPTSKGRCERRPVDQVEEKSDIVGGSSALPVDDPRLAEVANFALADIKKELGAAAEAISVARIVSATSQVVAGTKFDFVMELSNGMRHRVQVVDTPWLTPRLQLVSRNALQWMHL